MTPENIDINQPVTYKPKNIIIQDLIDFINGQSPITNNQKTSEQEAPLQANRLALFNLAIANAIAQGERELEAENITDLDSYLKFADEFIEWAPTVSSKGDEVFSKILVFYWPFKQKELSDLQTSIEPAFTDTDLRWISSWLVAYARRLGEYMSTPESVGNIWSFYTSHIYGRGPGDADKGTKYAKGDRYTQWKTPNGGWTSFNQWFSREWADIDYSRPLDGKGDDKVIVHAADARFKGQWDINNGIHEISAESGFKIKGVDRSIQELLRDIDGMKTYGNGSFIHATLALADYHRQHAPVEGKVVKATIVQEHIYLKIVQSKTENGKTTISSERDIAVSPQKLQRRANSTTKFEKKTSSKSQEDSQSPETNESELRSADVPKPDIGITAPDYAGYQRCQTRGLIVIDTSYDSKGNKKSVDHGLVAVLPFGMTQVSSVVLTVKEGQFLEKGQTISYFQFGGSDIVTVFQKRPTYRDGLEADKTKLHVKEKVAEWK